MKRPLAAAVAVLALSGCGSTAPKPTASAAPAASPSTSELPLPPTEAPATGATPGSTTTSVPASSAATSSPAPATAPPSPVATPLRLGVVASDRTTFSKLLTARRSLGGRSVVPTFVASCAQLRGVDLALVQGESCAGAPFPVLAAGAGLGDVTPTLTTITGLTVDDRVRLLLQRALDPKDGSVGVVVEGCPNEQRAVTKTLDPVAKQRGFTVAATATVPCGKSGDAGRAVATLQSKQARQVVFVSGNGEAALVRAFSRTARAKRYAPTYGVSSAAVPATLTDGREKTVGVGWLPTLDTTSATASVQINDCLRALRRAGATAPSTQAQRFAAYGACDLLALADWVLRLTRGSTDPAAVRGALKATGRLFKAASVLGSATDFRTRQTGPASVSTFAWEKGCRCMAYTGSPFAP